VVVDDAEVASTQQPVLVEGVGVERGIAVAEEQLGAGRPDLAVADDQPIGADGPAIGRGPLLERFARPRRAGDARELGRAVATTGADPEALDGPPDQAGRNVGPAAREHPE